jgi:hypothetical protein
LIAGSAMVLVYLVLQLVLEKMKPATGDIKASDVVAVVGAVTTFLGTAIGLFFGVTVGQSGKKSADDAAQSASKTAQQATRVAQQAQTVSAQSLGMLEQVRADAEAGEQVLRTQVQSLKRASVRFDSRLQRLHSLVNPSQRARAAASFAEAASAARPNDDRIREIVFDIVCSAVARAVGLESGLDVDTSKKLRTSPPGGFGISAGGYQRLCDDCTEQINTECDSALEMDNAFRDSHENGTVDAFINAAARLAIDNPRGVS